jgi:transitional endoplasmic reticulum ATPase
VDTGSLPPFAEEIRRAYLKGEACVFLLHGNIYDHVFHDGALVTLRTFLVEGLLKKKELVVTGGPGVVPVVRRKGEGADVPPELKKDGDFAEMLRGLDRLFQRNQGVGLVLEYAEMLAPAGDVHFMSEVDRRSVAQLHQWSLDRHLEAADHIVLLLAENLSELSPKLVGAPRVRAVEVPFPDSTLRAALIKRLEPDATPRELERLVAHSAGLRGVQIQSILSPAEAEEEDYGDRYDLIRKALGDVADAAERTKKLARVTRGMSREQIGNVLEAEGFPVLSAAEGDSRYAEVLTLLERRKRELIERECFGLVEFVEADHDFSHVGGMDAIKDQLMQIAHHIREGRRERVPMGLLFTGPMGTGKTFVAEAFARSSGLTAIKLKNFRSKWVGSTESNLEKILTLIRALGNIVVMIDEGDRALGGSGEMDGGTNSRVIARLKEFMSDGSNRGRILFIIMTNRPDKLDIDLKRAGRLDRKIPFFFAETAEAVEPVLTAQLRRHRVAHTLEFPRDREAVSALLVRYSNAELEAVTLLAHDRALTLGKPVDSEGMREAIADFLPARDERMLSWMELLAVFECSSRSMLPDRFRHLTSDALTERMHVLRSELGVR